MSKRWFATTSLYRLLRNIGISVTLAAMPLLARAQDPDDKPQPLDPEAAKMQLWAWGAITLIIVLPIVWYWFRRWQITRSGNVVDGESHIQD